MSEQALTRAVIQGLNATGLCTVWRNQSGRIQVRGGFMQLGPIGSPDVVGYARDGRFVGIEVKLPGEKPTLAQSDWRERIEQAGGVAGVVHGVAEAIELLTAATGRASRDQVTGREQ
jgi:hypothetical protein